MFNWGQVWIARKMYEIKSETITTLTTFSSATSFTFTLIRYIIFFTSTWWNSLRIFLFLSSFLLGSLVIYSFPSLFTLSIIFFSSFIILCSCHSRWSISTFSSNGECITLYFTVSQLIASLDHSLMPPLDIFTRLTTLTKSLIHSVSYSLALLLYLNLHIKSCRIRV